MPPFSQSAYTNSKPKVIEMQCQKGINRNHCLVLSMLHRVLALTRTHISIVIVIFVASLWPQHVFWEDLVELGDQILSEVHVCEQTHASSYFTGQERKKALQ